MTEEERCECCDLPESMCGKAAEKRKRAEERAEYARLLALPGATIARYAGQCGECGERFEEGAPIMARPGAAGHRQAIVRDGRSWRSMLCCPPS